MPHRWSIILVLACFAALFLACFFPVFFQGQQFGFRDAAHFYYPLYQKVQQEWNAGRVPLWEIEENAGMPLLGNPTAAVFYPPKILYGLFPYAWGARLYIVVHTALAFAAMVVLLRSWGTTWVGSGIGAMAYAFGAPILFQSANVIYLVGAAWLPLGVHAVDQWVRRGRRWALIELAVVLAMQLLGGEPQSGYLLGLAGIGYAAGLAWERAAAQRRAARAESGRESRPIPGWAWLTALIGLAILWIVVTIAVGSWVPRFREHKRPPEPLPWMHYVAPAVAAVWGVAGLAFAISWRRRRSRSPLGLAWVGMAGAAAMAVAVSAAQLLPVLEFTQRTSRAAEGGPHEIYAFSLEPTMLAGLIWPEVLGNSFDSNNSWAEIVRLPGSVPHIWVPSLYLGGLTFVLALGTLAVRRGAPWRVWLSVIVLVSLLGSLGEYTSPIWAARALAEGKRPYSWSLPEHKPGPREVMIDLAKIPESFRPLIRQLGPLDFDVDTPIRQDDFLRNGDGGIYWLMATLLPGFRQFRYPAKLFTLTALGLAALAGIGWDAIGRGHSRRATILTALLLAISLAMLAGVVANRQAIIARFISEPIASIYGPSDPVAAYGALRWGLLQGSVVLALGLVAFRLAASRPRTAGLLVLLVTTIDLGVANRRFILTVPQAALEDKPEVLQAIENAERAAPSPGPFRIHRMPAWDPPYWHRASSPHRSEEIVRWERGTLQPKYGLPLGVEYAHAIGVAELYEYEWYYGGFPWTVHDPEMARLLNIAVGDQIVYFPRRTFDMWNARYFVVPMWPNGWTDSFRGFASLLLDSERIYPPKDEFQGPGGEEKNREWTEKKDLLILRNRRPHPRAWVAHQVRYIQSPEGLDAGAERQRAMKEITYDNDPLWTDASRQAFDAHRYVWIETRDRPALLSAFSHQSSPSSETVKVTYPSPQRVELDVKLESPGMVVLADIFYPGWELTIDGVPAPIYRANRAMRGAAVMSGPHHLVYTYNPRSYRLGLIATAFGLAAMLTFAAFCSFRPVEPAIGELDKPEPSETDHE